MLIAWIIERKTSNYIGRKAPSSSPPKLGKISVKFKSEVPRGFVESCVCSTPGKHEKKQGANIPSHSTWCIFFVVFRELHV